MKKRSRILVVEDESCIREPLVEYLRHLGYEVEVAENGIEALNYIRERNYDLMTLDMKMPYIDGIQLNRTLQEEGVAIPVLVITAVESAEQLYQEIGRIIKPFGFKQLADKITGLLGIPK